MEWLTGSVQRSLLLGIEVRLELLLQPIRPLPDERADVLLVQARVDIGVT